MKNLLKCLMATTVSLALVMPVMTSAAEIEATTDSAISTNPSPEETTMTFGRGSNKIVIRAEAPSSFHLPPELLTKLSADQIMELEKARRNDIPIEGLLVPIAFFGGIVAIVALVTSYRLRKARMLQETIRTMVDKGAPIPPELLLTPEPRKRPRSDLRAGLGWSGIGVGLLVYLSGQGHRLWALGLIPLLIGIAYLIAWKVESRKVQ